MLRGLVGFLLICQALCVPVIPRKKLSEEALKKELSEADYQKLRQELASEKFDAVKKYVHLKPEEREQYVKKLKEEYDQRMRHETVYEPGSRPQLREVWRDEDHMDEDSYSPQMLFKKHDLNEDHVLDIHEINALIEHEIEKVYPGDSLEHEDMRELEMRRMRRAFFQRMDFNKDGKVSLNEFLSPMQDDDDDDEWIPLEDLQELPDFENKSEDKDVMDFAKKQLDLHPDDAELEEVMHVLHGVKGVPDPSHNPPNSAKSYADIKAASPPKPASGGGAAMPPPSVDPASSNEQIPPKPS